MTDPVDPPDLFGLARSIDPEESQQISRTLTDAWVAQHGRPPARLDDDLAALAPLEPGRKPGGVRDLVLGAGRLGSDRRSLPARLVIPVGATRALVTPEGRIVLEVLRIMAAQQRTEVDRALMLFAHEHASQFYSEPQLGWVTGHARGGDVRPTTIAFSLLLLVNGSIGEPRALHVPTESEDERRLAAAVAPVIDAFAEGIGAPGLNPAEVRRGMRSLWPITETPSQLVGQVLRTPRGKASFWIDEQEEDALVRRLGALLAARSRPRINRTRVDDAFAALVRAYADARPALAARRMAFDRRDRTRRIAERLGVAFDRAQTG